MTATDPSTPIILGNASGEIVVESKLSDYWPFPYQYRYCLRCDVVSSAEEFHSKVIQTKEETLFEQYPHLPELLASARSVNEKDSLDNIHPIRFSAAVYFSDGQIVNSWFFKALEYGCSVDPVVQLLSTMKKRCTENEGVKAEMIVMIDQFDNCHAPFAAARTLLSEHGFPDVKVVVHNSEGKMVVSEVKELFPTNIGTFSHDEFQKQQQEPAK
jgi:hypothetical protein